MLNLYTIIKIGGEKKDVRISVSNEYGQFLSPEHADYVGFCDEK